MHFYDLLHTTSLQQPIALLVGVDAERGRLVGFQHLTRMAVEGDHHGVQPPLHSLPLKHHQNMPVADMDAVKHAHRHRRIVWQLANIY